MNSEENYAKKCFIITPIGSDDSPIRRATDGVIDAVIIPALKELGFQERNIKVAHRMPNPGSINRQVITSVLEDDLVVANLTGLNPNVMYELAIRHAAKKSVVQICESETQLPFDISDERTIKYVNDFAGSIDLKNRFIEIVSIALEEKEPDNPIYRIIGNNSILKDVAVNDVSKYILQRLDAFEDKLVNLANNISPFNLSFQASLPEEFRQRIGRTTRLKSNNIANTDKILRTPIEYMALPSDVMDKLKNASINIIAQLVHKSVSDLMMISGFEEHDLEKIASALSEYGLRLRED